MKICSKCKVPKPFSNFSKSSANKDGLYAWCKDCKADSQRYYRQTEVGKECHSKYQKKYRKTKFGKLKRNKGRKLWKLNYPERNKAHTAVHRALKNGTLFQLPCEVCNSLDSEAHHDDYSKPLEVRWMCHKDHMKFNKENDNKGI